MLRATSVAAIALAISVISAIPALAQVGGSYRATCRDVEQRGSTLSALCRDVQGNFVPSQIDMRNCSGGVSNSNGRLTCGGGGYGRRDRDEDRYEGRRRRSDDEDYGSRRRRSDDEDYGYRRPRY